MNTIHNYNYNTKLYFQWSHDIDFDYTNGKYPNGTEPDFTWEDNFIPINHIVAGEEVGGHVWKREKLGIDNRWGLPYKISISELDLLNIDKKILDGLDYTSPILIEDYKISHLDTEGYKHIPVGGNELDVLIKSTENNYTWVPQKELTINLSSYSKTIELESGKLDDRYYTELEVDDLLKTKADLYHTHLEYVTKKELEYPNVDLSDYYTKSQIDYKIADIEIPEITGGDGTWGSITGTLSDQVDLQSALNLKKDYFVENTGFNLDLGTTSGTVAEGNHTHLLPENPVLFTTSAEAIAAGISTIARYRLEANNIINISGQITLSQEIALGTGGAYGLFSEFIPYVPYDQITVYVYNKLRETTSLIQLSIPNTRFELLISTFDGANALVGTYYFNLRYKYKSI